jgi:hypothetical protein
LHIPPTLCFRNISGALMRAVKEHKMSKPVQPAPLSRRTIFAGAGAVGAVATLAAVLPRTPAAPVVAEVPKPVPDTAGGYQVTQHVLRYYQTAKV